MDLKEKIRLFNAYALTNSVSMYNEEGLTAQQLAIKSQEKIKECLEMVLFLNEKLENLYNSLSIKYNEEDKELVLTMAEQIETLKEQVNCSYVCLYNEKAMTSLELAGNTAKATNECLKAVNMLADLTKEIYKLAHLGYDSAERMLIIGGE